MLQLKKRDADAKARARSSDFARPCKVRWKGVVDFGWVLSSSSMLVYLLNLGFAGWAASGVIVFPASLLAGAVLYVCVLYLCPFCFCPSASPLLLPIMCAGGGQEV